MARHVGYEWIARFHIANHVTLLDDGIGSLQHHSIRQARHCTGAYLRVGDPWHAGCNLESAASDEILTIDLWRDENIVSFEARVKAPGVTAIKNGKTVLRA